MTLLKGYLKYYSHKVSIKNLLSTFRRGLKTPNYFIKCQQKEISWIANLNVSCPHFPTNTCSRTFLSLLICCGSISKPLKM